MAPQGHASILSRLSQLAERLERETYALYLAYKDPRLPWYAKVFAAFVVAHTFSPIDTIPDFIPVLGYLDDLIITPLGIYLALKMIPTEVMIDARQRAALAKAEGKIRSRAGIAIVVAIWAIGFVLVAFVDYRYAAQ